MTLADLFSFEKHLVVVTVAAHADVEGFARQAFANHFVIGAGVVENHVALRAHVDPGRLVVLIVLGLEDGGAVRFDDGAGVAPFMPVAAFPVELGEGLDPRGDGPRAAHFRFSLEQTEPLCASILLIPARSFVEIAARDRAVSQSVDADVPGYPHLVSGVSSTSFCSR